MRNDDYVAGSERMNTPRLRQWVVGYFVIGGLLAAGLVVWLVVGRSASPRQHSPAPLAAAAPGTALRFLTLVSTGRMAQARRMFDPSLAVTVTDADLRTLRRRISGARLQPLGRGPKKDLVTAGLRGVGTSVPGGVVDFKFNAGKNSADVYLVAESGAWRVWAYGYGDAYG